MSINFLNKYLLILLPIITFAVIYISRNEAKNFYEKIIVGLRIVILSLLIFALASPNISISTDNVSTLFLYDISDSNRRNIDVADEFINDSLKGKKDKKPVGLVAFGENSFVDTAPTSDFKLKDVSVYENREFTNIKKALETSNNLIGKDNGKRLVVLSDGNENIDDAENYANILKSQNTVIDVFYTGSSLEKEVELTDLILPQNINKNAKYDIEVSVSSLSETTGNLTIYKNKDEIINKEISIKKGENRYLFSDVSTEGGYVLYKAEISSKDDTMPENNSFSAYANVIDSPKILVVEKDGSGEEVKKLLLSGEANVETIDAQAVSTELDKINKYDCVILCNVEYEDLPKGFDQTIKNYVINLGGGFINTGGENSFAPGGYIGTEFENFLPVTFDLKTESENPSLGMIMVIDRSSSMSSSNYGLSVMEIAKEAAIRGIETMNDKDMLGVIAFDSEYEWVVPYAKIGKNKDGIIEKVAQIQPMGGTSILPGFSKAYDTLLTSPAKYNHIILLTDGQAERTGYDKVIKGMKNNGITLTTIAVGSGADTSLMESLAKQADGRFYFTNEFTNLPRIFAKETRLANKEYLNNETFYPEAGDYSKITEKIESISPLDGYVSTTIKPRAEMVLKSYKDEPVLSTMNVGIGKTAVFTSDLNSAWTNKFLSSTDGQNIIKNTVSYVMRKNTENVDIMGKRNGSVTEISANMPFDSSIKKVYGTVFDSDNKAFDVALSQVKPGDFKGKIPMLKEGSYIVKLNIERDNDIKTALSAFNIPYSDEYKISNMGNGKEKLEKLSEITGGKVLISGQEVFSDREIVTIYKKSLKNIFIVIALLLFVLEIFLRRFDYFRRKLELIFANKTSKKEEKLKNKNQRIKEEVKNEGVLKQHSEIKSDKEEEKKNTQTEENKKNASSIDRLIQKKRKR